MPEPIRVLYVDDEPGLLELGKSFLGKEDGFVVDTAESATLALAHLDTHPCDAIVSDYQMPEVNGIEFLKTVRGSGRTVPFILFTGRGREEVVIEAINNGVDFYLQKGGDTLALFAELSHKIRQAVSRNRAQDELQAAYEQLTASEEELRSQLEVIMENQEALVKSEEKFRDLVETSLDPIWEMDMNGTFTYMSQACLEVLGYSPEEVQGKTVFSLVAEPARQAFFHEFATHDRSAKVTRELELPLLCRDGRAKLFEIRSIPRLDAKHQLIGFRGIARDITERRKAEDRLRKSEEKFRSLVETSPDMIWEVNLEGTVLYASPKVKDIMGYAPELLIGKSVGDFIPEQARPRFGQIMQEFTASTASIAPIEFPGVHRDGHPVFLEIRVARITGPDGKTIGFRGTGRDITERRKAEDLLKKSEEKFRSLVETSPDMVWEIDREGRILYISPKVTDFMGYAPEDLVGKNVADAIPPQARSHFREMMVEYALSTGPIPPLEFPAVHRDGHPMILEIRVARMSGPDGKVTGFRGTGRDITDWRSAERALKESERRYRESEENYRGLVETSPNIIWERTIGGAFSYISPRVKTLLGYTQEEMQKKSLLDIVTPKGAEVIGAALAQARSTGVLPPSIEVTVIHRDGHEVILEIRPGLIDGGREKSAIRGVAVDITARKRAEEAVAAANKKFHLLSSITRHDILNQLSVVSGYLALEEKQGTMDPRYRASMQKSLERIRVQLEFSRDYEEVGQKEPSWISPETLFRQVARGFSDRGVTLSCATGTAQVLTDPMIERAFYNLIDNSLSHGGPVTEIRLSLDTTGTEPVLVYEDNGTGVPAEIKEKIFDKGVGRNTGLGLFLIREILSITGITIRETGEPGQGVRFEMVVPKAAFRAGA